MKLAVKAGGNDLCTARNVVRAFNSKFLKGVYLYATQTARSSDVRYQSWGNEILQRTEHSTAYFVIIIALLLQSWNLGYGWTANPALQEAAVGIQR
jgi:hypothetical protein